MTVNIALTGKLRSGKDSVAAYLVANYGYTRFAFGDELKRYAHLLFGDTSAKPRELYQFFGQTMRQRDPEIWTRKMFETVDSIAARRVLQLDGSFVKRDLKAVISDLRQPNEISALRQRGYTIIRVTCPDEIRLERARLAGDIFDVATLTHDTESHVDGFDVQYELENAGTLDELFLAVDAVMTKLTEVNA